MSTKWESLNRKACESEKITLKIKAIDDEIAALIAKAKELKSESSAWHEDSSCSQTGNVVQDRPTVMLDEKVIALKSFGNVETGADGMKVHGTSFYYSDDGVFGDLILSRSATVEIVCRMDRNPKRQIFPILTIGDGERQRLFTVDVRDGGQLAVQSFSKKWYSEQVRSPVKIDITRQTTITCVISQHGVKVYVNGTYIYMSPLGHVNTLSARRLTVAMYEGKEPADLLRQYKRISFFSRELSDQQIEQRVKE